MTHDMPRDLHRLHWAELHCNLRQSLAKVSNIPSLPEDTNRSRAAFAYDIKGMTQEEKSAYQLVISL